MDNLKKEQNTQWSGRTGGNVWMHTILIWFFKWVNIRFFYAIMAIIILFYMLFSHKGYVSMYHFFRNRLGYSPFRSFCKVYLNHFKFGQIILDRFAVYAGKNFKFEFEGLDIFNDLVCKKDGFVQLSSHVGNYELAGYSLNSDKKRFNALVFDGEVESVMKNREKILSGNNMRMIPVKSDMSHIFLMNNALADGEILSIPGDRVFGSSKTVSCNFFGEDAKFPIGPYVLAVQRDVPIISVFVMKEGVFKYKVIIKRVIINKNDVGNREKLNLLANSFAKNLEEVVKLYPTQWFNYFEFWEQ